ncbi:MAG TPA: cyclic nucleotide-binding domain-containing protein [Nitrospirales bacterium]|nr:cyclic nucleotide-binding domain-containing protein [Nitrospirales bacterium]HIB55034.1 cyclic nucleotide-binding domain-containing protein [Nitrospirales bacterium]HIC04780.1 cyclic nucleotide-binding domain-containing protein [Nitrospirales bacterium]HIO21499.1 cyclic nucleotide-binding domain-containing protein [Nitrospirales bacterium]HIO69838.1 cyclic nucleotide-binding domain-containing protein [Nitrospirales bacterium]
MRRGFPEAEFDSGDVLLTEGERTGLLYVLIEGEVEISKSNFPVTTISDSGAMFGDMAILLDLPHTATVKAYTHCRVRIIQHGRDFLQSNPLVVYHLAKHMAVRRMYGSTNYLVDLNQKLCDVNEAIRGAISHQFAAISVLPS